MSLRIQHSVPCHAPASSAVREPLFAPPSFSRVGSAISPANVGVRLQFAVYGFQFCCLPRGCAGLFSRGQGCIREPSVVCNAHLYLLQFHAGRFGASCQGEMVLLGVV
jgi:hypothetical protein